MWDTSPIFIVTWEYDDNTNCGTKYQVLWANTFIDRTKLVGVKSVLSSFIMAKMTSIPELLCTTTNVHKSTFDNMLEYKFLLLKEITFSLQETEWNIFSFFTIFFKSTTKVVFELSTKVWRFYCYIMFLRSLQSLFFLLLYQERKNIYTQEVFFFLSRSVYL